MDPDPVAGLLANRLIICVVLPDTTLSPASRLLRSVHFSS